MRDLFESLPHQGSGCVGKALVLLCLSRCCWVCVIVAVYTYWQVSNADAVLKAGLSAGVNLRKVDGQHVGISLDETTTVADVDTLLKV